MEQVRKLRCLTDCVGPCCPQRTLGRLVEGFGSAELSCIFLGDSLMFCSNSGMKRIFNISRLKENPCTGHYKVRHGKCLLS